MISYSCGHTEFDDERIEQRDERCPACLEITRISLAKRATKQAKQRKAANAKRDRSRR